MVEKGAIQQQLSQSGSLQKYRSIVIGDKSTTAFLLYEFLTTTICPLPGSLGMYARRFFMPLLFNRFGCKVRMKQNVTFRRPHQIRIGNNVILENGVTIDVKSNSATIEINDDVHIGTNTILSCLGGSIIIGKGTCIGKNCRLGSLKGLTIGQHSKIDDSVCIVGAGHAYNSRVIPIIQQPLTCKGPTVIEDYVEIEKEVTLLDGVHIGQKAKIIANSLVNNTIAPNCKAEGVPASPC